MSEMPSFEPLQKTSECSELWVTPPIVVVEELRDAGKAGKEAVVTKYNN